MTCRCPEPEVASRSGSAYCAKCGDCLPWTKGGKAMYEESRAAARMSATSPDAPQILCKAREDELIRAITTRSHDAPYFNLRNIIRLAIVDGYEAGKVGKLPASEGRSSPIMPMPLACPYCKATGRAIAAKGGGDGGICLICAGTRYIWVINQAAGSDTSP